MIDEGAKVYSYDDESFIHAKIMIVDSEDAAVGTANFDVRSFRLNHELMVYLYDNSQAIQHLVKDFKQDINDSKQLRSEENTSELQSRGNIVCRLLLEKTNLRYDNYQT